MIKYFEKNRIIPIVLIILITIEIFYFSSLPGTFGTGVPESPWIARAYHFIVFFLFSFFLLMAIKGKNKMELKHLVITVFLSVAHAVLDEFHQIFVPFRDASVRDVLIDSLGIFSAMLIYKFIDKKANQ